MVTNRDVAKAWQQGKPAKVGALWTDGKLLRSYQLLIGKTEKGKKIAIDYTTKGGAFYSSTTSTHVGLAKALADKTIAPPKNRE